MKIRVLVIYNKETFNSDITIKNNLSNFYNFIQLKNKYLACSFSTESTLKIIKIKNNENETIQIITQQHSNTINSIMKLKNENIITFSSDYGFKIWKLNNKYKKIFEFKDNNNLSDGLEIKDNEVLLYALAPNTLIFII